jgi:hypothetical protein
MDFHYKKMNQASKFSSISPIPKIELSGMNVICNGRKLNLARKSRAYRIIRAFFTNDKPTYSADQLIFTLCKEEGLPMSNNSKLKQCRRTSLIRMLSRMREEFQNTFQTVVPNGTSWFYYDRPKKHWVLFKMPSTGADGQLY